MLSLVVLCNSSEPPFHMAPPPTTNTVCCFNPSAHFTGTNILRQRLFLKNTSFVVTFSASKSVLFGGFVTRRPVLPRGRIWVPSNAMNQSTKSSALRDENRDDSIQVFEQEALVEEGSAGFQPKFLSHDLESTLNRLSKWIVAALFGGFIIWKHDAEALWFAGGSILNAQLSIILKHILNQERPTALKSDPGMPSSHAQSIFFIVIFFNLSSVEWLGLNVLSFSISGLLLACGSYLSYLRVSQQLHTVNQVVVGGAIGSICSILWYWLWNASVSDAYASSSWVRIALVSGSIGLCLGFVFFPVRHWLQDD